MSKFDEDFERELARLEEEKKKKKKNQKTFGNVIAETLDRGLGEGRLNTLPSANDSPQTLITDLRSKLSSATNNDIGPVLNVSNNKNKEEKRTWFTKGAFKDGYDFGDVTKTILGTATDAVHEFGEGIVEMGENAIDTGTYIYGLFKNDDERRKIVDFIKQDTIDSDAFMKWGGEYAAVPALLKLLGSDYEDTSVLGERTDSLVNSGGQLAAQIGLQAVGVPWALTSGVTSFGSSVESSLNEGASYGEAGLTGIINAGAEIVSEKLFGGSGLGEKGLINLQPLTKWISNKTAKALADYGVDFLAEGAEEVFSQVIGNLGSALYKEESVWELLTNEEAFDEYLESFIGGMALSGVANTGKVKKSVESGRDYRTGRTTNEEAVVRKEVEKRIAEMEAGGEKITKKVKETVEAEIEEALNRGEISIDTIEEVLGGEEYQQYMKGKEFEDSVQKEYEDLMTEYDELYNMKNGDKSSKQVDRETELRDKLLPEAEARLGDVASKSTLAQTADSLRRRILETAKQDRVGETFYNTARKGQKFDADVSKYDTKQQDHVKRAIESGVLDNSRASHDVVDMGAKVESDTGLKVHYTTSAKIKADGKHPKRTFNLTGDGQTTEFDLKYKNLDSNAQPVVEVNGQVISDGYTVDFETGKIKFENAPSGTIKVTAEGMETVDAYIENGEIYLNVKSPKWLEMLTGHEVTHALEKGKHYDKLSKAVKAFAQAKGEYDARLADALNRYAGVEASAEREVIADLIGEYVFSGSDFIMDLAVKDRNVFQRVYDQIKYLCKVVTAGSKEARKLEKVKKEFARVYREVSKKGATVGRRQYSLAMVEDVQPTSEMWSRTHTTEEAMEAFPNMWNIAADESEVRNPTQITSTVKTYRKIYNFLQNEGFDGTILDASSGLGYGTRAGIEEFGFDVEDIEPYPDKGYEPMYQDYSTLDKQYDVIISNAVLNVLPQDQRDALVVKMGEMLNDGGRLFVNVRGKDVESLAKTGKNIHLGNMEWIETVKGSYQKGFTKPELVAYLEDALGEGFTVKPTNLVSGVAAIVTKDGGVQYSLSDSDGEYGDRSKFQVIDGYRPRQTDSEGKELTDEQTEYFKKSKMRDADGKLKVMYHGSQYGGFHVFNPDRSDDGISLFFTDSNDVAMSYSGTSETYAARSFKTAEDLNKFFAEIGKPYYEVNEENGKFILLENEEFVAESDTATGAYEEFCDWDGVGYGDVNYKVYLNLTNPLEVDAKGANWNRISNGFSQELYDKYKALTDEQKNALTQLASWEDMSIFRGELREAYNRAQSGDTDAYTQNLAIAYRDLGGEKADMYRMFDIASDNFSEESLQENAVEYLKTRDFAQRAKAQGYDGVIFKNIYDNGMYGGNDISTVAIAFDSNQVKSVANTQPTGDSDIRYSLSEDSNGRKLSAKQSEYFKDSKALDSNGNLQIVYHGTQNADFTVFKRNVNFFTDSKEMADSYSPNGAMYEGYVNITKPYEIDAAGEKWSKIPVDDETKDFLQEYGSSVFMEGGKWRTTTNDLASAIEEAVDNGDMDYDGIIIRNIDDTGSYYKGKDSQLATDYIVFNSNQFKNADNQNPTSDPDIRFSLSESVEETKDLMAIHNLTEEKLLKSLKMGGLPMPSVAIARAKDGHGEFGDISLVLSKEAIDPEYSRRNKLYSGDAWTPTYPQVSYKPSAKVLDEVRSKINGIVPYDVQNVLGSLSFDTDNASSALDRYSGNMVEAYKQNDSMKYAYLKDIGSDISLPMKEADLYHYGQVSNAAVRYFSGKLIGGLQTIEKYRNMSAGDLLQDKALTEAIADAQNFDVLRTFEPGSAEYLEYEQNPVFRADEVSFRDIDSMLSAARKLLKNGVQQTVDRKAAKELIRNAVDQDAYENWLGELFTGVVEKEGIRNNRDYFTPSGNRRSFEALHYEHNLENVIKAMREQGEKGIGNGFGGASIFGASTTEFSSIKEMKQAGERLQTMSYDEYQELRKGFTDRFLEIAMRLPNEKNSFSATDSAAEVLTEAVAKYSTRRGISNYLKKELSGWATYSEQTVDDLIKLVNDIRSMPTGYFEAKPQRAVGFDEVGVFIIPNDADVKLKQELLNRGYNIAEYDPNVEGDRTRVLNQFEEYMFSLSNVSDKAPTRSGYRRTRGIDVAYQSPYEDIAPTVSEMETVESVSERDIIGIPATEEEVSAYGMEMLDHTSDTDAPPEMDAPYFEDSQAEVEDPFEDRDWFEVSRSRKTPAYMYENPEVKPFFQDEAQKMLDEFNNTVRGERWFNDEAYYNSNGESGFGGVSRFTSKSMETLLDDWKMRYDDIEKGLKAIIEDNGAENIAAAKKIEFMLNDRLLNGYEDFWTGQQMPPSQEYIQALEEKQITEYHQEAFDRLMANPDQFAPYEEAPVADETKVKQETVTTEDIAPLYDAIPKKGVLEGQQSLVQEEEAPKELTRKELHKNIIDRMKAKFAGKGYDLDTVLDKAKNLSTFATVDNTPQRVMEKALGYKEGGILADITVNQVAQNESAGIKWLNSFTNRKNGLLAQISRQYRIKPGSKESAAAQMYAEGFYVNEVNDIVKYGDAELFKDFRDPAVRSRIKGLANDPRIRQIYDETLNAINESRTRNAYPEIPRLDNYFLHFRAMNDTFSRLGLPFNPNDIRAKDLPTDLNGVTADLKPGQPYFASAQHRRGIRTSFDLLGGLEQYLTSAKNQIYHIDDIQNLRALRNYIADMYGQANGLEGLDILTEEEAQDRIEQVYGAHLSTFAKFLNEEANVLAGKTALIDRGLEGIIGRRGMTFLNEVNKQVGSNMVGYNISSSLTNFLAPVQALAKTNKASFVKGMAQFTSNKIASIFGKGDGFAEQSPVMIRRQGADRFHRTFWQKMSDPGYMLMSAVDNVSTELIARAKYNEFIKKGMDSQQAHIETDKWTSRLMGDRSLGQMPQIYNSKMLGLITKFQLEVRNQLDSQFYDTIQEAKVSSEHIQNGLLRNAKKAAKITSALVQLAIGQHIFGKAFESVAGYNPAFDIISTIMTAFGWDDEEESEDTVLDNIEQAFLDLLEDLPYTSTLTGGRIPISSALPVADLIKGEDQYGNEKSRLEILGEVAPYYLMPGGYGQLKKTKAGLEMFSDEHPIAGSYTDSGKLRFPVEDNVKNRVQAAIFGQYASENARDYFDNERSALTDKQVREFRELKNTGMSIQEYWDYREGLKGLDKLEDKVDYIYGLNLSTYQKNILVNNLTDRKEKIDLTHYGEYGSFEEFDYAMENPEKYKFLEDEGIGYWGYKSLDADTKDSWSWAFSHQDEYRYYKENGVMPEDYRVYRVPMLDFDNEEDKAYEWAFDYPEKASLGKVFSKGVTEYRQYTNDLSDMKADKDKNGNSISGSKKEKVVAYIESLDIDYGQKIILYRTMYSSKSDKAEYNAQIVEYLNGRDDISYDEMVAILEELDMTVKDGRVYWD